MSSVAHATFLIGVAAAERHACADDVHLPNCFNPQLNLTACACGAQWWRGLVGTWHSREIRRQVGVTTTGRPITEVTGWDRYFLHTGNCADRETATADPEHRCTDVAPMTAAEARGQSSLRGSGSGFAPGSSESGSRFGPLGSSPSGVGGSASWSWSWSWSSWSRPSGAGVVVMPGRYPQGVTV
jgi:hypothetical protein